MNAELWDQLYGEKELVWSADANRFVADTLAELPPGRALDLAAGEGRNAIWLALRGWRVHAIDFSRVAIDKARQLAAKHDVDVTWEVADLLEVELDDAAYDLVLLSYLQLVPEQMHIVLSKAQKALAPGGTFFLIGHADRNLRDGVGGPQDPAVLYSAEEIERQLGDLQVVQAEEVFRSVEKDGQTREAIDVLVHAQKWRAQAPTLPAT